MIAVFLADGFEEIEALATVDFLRRCELEVQTIGVGAKFIRGAHDIRVFTDWIQEDYLSEVSWEPYECIVLPGGMPGTANLEDDHLVQSAIEYAYQNNRLIAAICAAPSILAHFRLLEGKYATCFPGYEDDLRDSGAFVITDRPVVEDGNFITSRGVGTVFDFAEAIAARFVGAEKARQVRVSMLA
ncbi:MAG: DJ-1/PfpI family protein [Oscillospiraceae bacterium]|nr:DJ-1/PfpI family protein [Oscillospiraceae bacterium]